MMVIITNECPTDYRFLTRMYAGEPLTASEITTLKYNLGQQITGIIEWGRVSGTGNLGIHGFRVDHDSISTVTHGYNLGDNSIDNHCTPFSISTNDFISGYTVGYDAFITYLAFHTNNGQTYSCNAATSSTAIDSWNSNDCVSTTGHNYYLSGWNYTSGNHIISIYTIYPITY